MKLIRALATGEKTRAELARERGVTATAISEFRKRHADAIAEVAANVADEYAGLWIAQKRERLAAYQQNAEIIAAEIEALRDGRVIVHGGEADDDDAELGDSDTDEPLNDVSGAIGRLTRAYDRALRSVAEELGQLPTRMVVKNEGGGAVHVYGAGVDTDKV
jgi:hypothetical protein